MPGYLFQIAASATAGGRTDGPRLRPSVRSRSPIADYDQRLGRTDWDATAGANLANESGQGPGDNRTLTIDTGDPGALGRPQPQLTAAQLRSSAIELAHPVPAVDRPATPSTGPAEVATSHGIRGYRQLSTEPAEPEPAAAVLDQPKQPVFVRTSNKERPAMERKQPAIRPDPTAPSLPLIEPARSDASKGVAAPPTAVASRSHRTAPSEEPSGERVQPPSAAPRERTMPTAAMRQRRARGLADGVGEMRSAAGPRVIIDRLEIEIVPPPPVSARRPGTGEGVGVNRAVSKIGPLNDPMAVGRALSLRYR